MSDALWWVLRYGVMMFIGVFMTYYICSKQWSNLSTIVVISTALSFFWMAWNWYIWSKWFSPLRKLPGPDGGHWILGQLPNIIAADPGVTMLQWMNSISNQGIIRYLGVLNQERLLVTSPRALADVLVTHQEDFQKPAPVRWSISRVLGNGVFLAEGSEHRHQRKLLEPAFSFRHIKNLYPIFWSKAAESVEAMTSQMLSSPGSALPFSTSPGNSGSEKTDWTRLDTHSVLEVDGWAFRLSLDIIGAAGLGRDFGSVRDQQNPLVKAYHDVYKPTGQALILDLLYLILPGPIVNLIPTTRNIEYVQAARIIKGICQDIISEKRARLAIEKLLDEDSNQDADITSVLLRNTGMDDEAVLAQMMTLLAAGHEAPAAAFTWAVYLLCLHPDVQHHLRTEVRARLPSPSHRKQPIVAAQIDSLPYLIAVCSEVLRFMAPSPLTIREAVNDTTVAGEFVPKGTYVMLSLWAMNRNPGLWGSDAGQFNPDRWLATVTNPETGQDTIRVSKNGGAESNYAFMTFLHGRKNCIGQNFAMAELACVLANWVGRFEFTLRNPADANNLEINRGGVTMRPAHGLYVKVRVVDGW